MNKFINFLNQNTPTKTLPLEPTSNSSNNFINFLNNSGTPDISTQTTGQTEWQKKSPLQRYSTMEMSKSKMFTSAMGKTLGSILAAVNVAPTIFGGKLEQQQQIQKECVISGNVHVDKEEIQQFLEKLEYPLYYLDFETLGPAVPVYDGTRPYQGIPFQFSLHVQRMPGDEPVHYSFLAEGRQDPRPELLASLSRMVGDSGSVIVYNRSFEESVLRELGNAFPDYAGWTESAISRLVDLIVPFRGFQYYHPSQKGSVSLKSVLSALTGSGYEDMPIANGGDASLAFLAITFEDELRVS